MEVRELPPELAVCRAHSQLSLWLVMPVSKRDAKKTHEDPSKSSRGSGARSTQCSCEGSEFNSNSRRSNMVFWLPQALILIRHTLTPT